MLRHVADTDIRCSIGGHGCNRRAGRIGKRSWIHWQRVVMEECSKPCRAKEKCIPEDGNGKASIGRLLGEFKNDHRLGLDTDELDIRYMSRKHYDYILSLPLVLHIPSLHTFVVHAGLLPHNPHKSLSDPTQPLIAASDSFIADVDTARMAEELSILLDVPQNADPWTLMNMRSVYTHGQKKGRVSKSAKKGSPWSELWKEEMKRCTGQGYWEDSADDEEGVGVVEELVDADEGDDDELQEQRDRGAEEELSKLKCSPVTVIYGHAGE